MENILDISNKKLLIMGILNITPDSFSDGNCYFSEKQSIDKAISLIEDGTDIIDIGGQSTRPGYHEISPDEEWARIKNTIKYIKSNFKTLISVDTYYEEVMLKALNEGADIINDISGKTSINAVKEIQNFNKYLVLTYNKEIISDNIINETNSFFNQTSTYYFDNGLKPESLIIDPGYGFNKSREQDIELIRNLDKITFPAPIMVGISRKRTIGQLSGIENPNNRDFATLITELHTVYKGASILRTHNVKITSEALNIINNIDGVNNDKN